MNAPIITEEPSSLINQMKILLGSTVSLYYKVQSMHWNVEGPDFYQYHTMLQKIYEDIYGTVDTIGEYIRALDSYAPTTLARLCELSCIDEQPKIPRAELMIAELYNDMCKMKDLSNSIFKCAADAGVENIANYAAELLDIYTKYAWFLKATLNKARA
jgi:starvation-inducible DNA-binding protein